MAYFKKVKTPCGTLYIVEENGFIVKISDKVPENDEVEKETLLLQMMYVQINEYFMGTRRIFDVPYLLTGTEFRKKVWEELRNIPYGETRSYADVAKAIGNEKSSRAVGQANRYNPLWIVIPCHRVVNTDGGISGYAGGVEMKKYLLDLEKRYL